MPDRQSVEPDYLVRRVADELARAEGELGIVVEVVHGVVYLTGVVPTDERRRRVEDVARRICPDLAVQNEIAVLPPTPAGDPESLP
jgi:osmotically-inducible protein OsmY